MRANLWAKKADRFLGIPIVLLLGLWRRKRPLPARIERIGVLKEAAIGDTVVLAAALADVRRAHPQARIVVFAGPSNAEFARLLDHVDEVVRLPLNRPWACAAILRRAELDVLLDYGQWPRINAILAFFSGARHCIGFRTEGQHRHAVYDATSEHRRDAHEVENFRALAAILGPGLGEPVFALRFQRFDAVAPKPYAVVHMWPGGERSELKEWPAACWRQLVDELLDRGFAIVLTGAPADRAGNQRFIATLAESRQVFDVAGRPMAALPALLLDSALVVSVNTGLMHLAAVLDVPTVGLCGPTSALRWGPRGKRAVAVSSDDPAGGYLHLGFEYPPACRAMERLSITKVLEAIDRLVCLPPEQSLAGDPGTRVLDAPAA